MSGCSGRKERKQTNAVILSWSMVSPRGQIKPESGFICPLGAATKLVETLRPKGAFLRFTDFKMGK